MWQYIVINIIIVSNAFEKSMKMAIVAYFVKRQGYFEFVSIASAISLINCSTGWVVECFERNPYWCLHNIMSFSSKNKLIYCIQFFLEL